jgi:protein-S-isoprenylcysteine O-methyltransferase Ste14
MKHLIEFLFKGALLAFICYIFWLAQTVSLSNSKNLSIIMGGVLLIYPLILLGRKMLDNKPTISCANLITSIVHFGLGITIGISFICAITTHQNWPDWLFPIPPAIGLILTIITGIVSLSVGLKLAMRGFGAPGILLSRKFAVDLLYSRTRIPMVLAGLAFFLSLGICFRSALFSLWVLFLFNPAILFFVKIYEERQLELRFRNIIIAI